jgi:glutamine synthetase adenylyltransferase
MIEGLARRFAREIASAADPERAMNNLDRFIRGVGARSFYWGLLLDRPELVTRLAKLFGASRFLSMVFATHPQLIEPVFSDRASSGSPGAEPRGARRDRAELGSPESRDDTELALAACASSSAASRQRGPARPGRKISASEAEAA